MLIMPRNHVTFTYVHGCTQSTLCHHNKLIIIIDIYGAYILRNLSSEARQNRISKRNRKQGRAKVSIRTRDNRTFMMGMQVGIDMS